MAVGDGSVGGDGGGDGSSGDGATLTCLQAWHAGTIRFATPTQLTELASTGTSQRDPFLTPDETTIYFNALSQGVTHIYSATRAGVADPFGAVMQDSALDSGQNESKFTMTSDGLDAIYSSDRNGGAGGADLWETTRLDTTQDFGMSNEVNLTKVDTAGDEYDPELLGNGLELYFAPISTSPQTIYVTTRAALGQKFATPTPVTELNSGDGDADPAPSFDDTIILFTSARPASLPGKNLWYATRSTTALPFGPPQLVPDLNSGVDDGDPWLSEDGCRVYFTRDNTITGTTFRVYVASAQQ